VIHSLIDVSYYYQDGVYFKGPAFPTPSQYNTRGVNRPCISDIDEDTAFMSVGCDVDGIMLSDSWKYNFKTGSPQLL
jgi:hypothetical protein